MTPAVNDAVVKRCAGKCECGCGASVPPGERDHFFGRAKADETEATVWVLTPRCHYQKTQNFPDAGTWLLRFMRHCLTHGYVDSYKRAAETLAWKASKKGAGAHA